LKVGITGATGFLGGYILRHLQAARRYELRALARSLKGPLYPKHGISWVQGDLESPLDCQAFIGGLDVVVHLAHTNTPLSSHSDWASDAALNIIPTLNLIEAIRRENRPLDLVYASSGGAVYGSREDEMPFKEADSTHPSSPYGIVKLVVEEYLQLAAEQGWLRASILRIGNPYGELLQSARRQGLIGVAMNQVLRGEPVPIYGNPNNIRDYIHLSDVAKILELCLLRPSKEFVIYNVGSGRGASTLEILDILERTIGKPVMREHLKQIDHADRMISWTVLDITKAKKQLGWHPKVSLELGIANLYQQFRGSGGSQ
jgi:UDP-glucose 4-epimerase